MKKSISLLIGSLFLALASVEGASSAPKEVTITDRVQLTGWRFQTITGKNPFFKDSTGTLKGVFTKSGEEELMPSLLAIEENFYGSTDALPNWINHKYLNKEGVILNRVNLSHADRVRWLYIYQVPDQNRSFRVVSVIAMPLPGKVLLLTLESNLNTYKDDATELLAALK